MCIRDSYHIDHYQSSLFHKLFFFRIPFTKNKIDLCSFAETVSDADSDPWVLICCQRGAYMCKSVVATVAALRPHSDTAKREGNVVDNYNHIFQGDVFLFEPVTHGISTEIHICGGFQKD